MKLQEQNNGAKQDNKAGFSEIILGIPLFATVCFQL